MKRIYSGLLTVLLLSSASLSYAGKHTANLFYYTTKGGAYTTGAVATVATYVGIGTLDPTGSSLSVLAAQHVATNTMAQVVADGGGQSKGGGNGGGSSGGGQGGGGASGWFQPEKWAQKAYKFGDNLPLP